MDIKKQIKLTAISKLISGLILFFYEVSFVDELISRHNNTGIYALVNLNRYLEDNYFFICLSVCIIIISFLVWKDLKLYLILSQLLLPMVMIPCLLTALFDFYTFEWEVIIGSFIILVSILEYFFSIGLRKKLKISIKYNILSVLIGALNLVIVMIISS